MEVLLTHWENKRADRAIDPTGLIPDGFREFYAHEGR